MAQSKLTALYRSVGEELHHFDVDVEAASLTRRGTVRVPAGVQYVWPHPSRRYLYVASSNRGPGGAGAAGDTHHLTAFRVDAATGALEPHGEPVPLPSRPIHMSLDRTGDFALTAYNQPSSVTVHHIHRDGTIGAPVQQPAPLDTGIYAHQILATPDNRGDPRHPRQRSRGRAARGSRGARALSLRRRSAVELGLRGPRWG